MRPLTQKKHCVRGRCCAALLFRNSTANHAGYFRATNSSRFSQSLLLFVGGCCLSTCERRSRSGSKAKEKRTFSLLFLSPCTGEMRCNKPWPKILQKFTWNCIDFSGDTIYIEACYISCDFGACEGRPPDRTGEDKCPKSSSACRISEWCLMMRSC